MNNFFVISLAFWVAAASASNDVASDGFYMVGLERENVFFLGICSSLAAPCLPEMV
jgi:PAT family beta-lactamase induction signal transducer AmpG